MRQDWGCDVKHTKGPWELQTLDTAHNGYPGWKTFAIRSPQNVCLAVVGDVDHYHEPDHEANARLMQAAPDLLEALKIVLVQFGEYEDGQGAAKFHAVNIAKEAIAKAEPQAQAVPSGFISDNAWSE